jgi:hypothetical protein
LPLRLDGHSFDLRLQPPAVGEGGGDLLVQAGIGEEEIVALEAAGIVAARSCRRR